MSNHVIMAREMAPLASTENMYKQVGWNSLEGRLNTDEKCFLLVLLEGLV